MRDRVSHMHINLNRFVFNSMFHNSLLLSLLLWYARDGLIFCCYKTWWKMLTNSNCLLTNNFMHDAWHDLSWILIACYSMCIFSSIVIYGSSCSQNNYSKGFGLLFIRVFRRAYYYWVSPYIALMSLLNWGGSEKLNSLMNSVPFLEIIVWSLWFGTSFAMVVHLLRTHVRGVLIYCYCNRVFSLFVLFKV